MKLLLMKEDSSKNLAKIVEKVEILDCQEDKKRMIEIIKEAMQIKLSYMEGDEFDKGRRNLLNYGHEFGHALEPASDYQVPHGIAIVIGMIFANYISVKRKWMRSKLFDYLNENIFIPYMRRSMIKLKKDFFKPSTLLANMKKDKKRESSDLVLILPKENLNLCKVQDLTIQEFETGLREVQKILIF